MRIGITCYPTYGGSGVVATELGMELAARGHEIHFISYAPPIRLNQRDAEYIFSRSGGLHVSAFRSRSVHADARHENAGSGRIGVARSAARALRDSAFGERVAGARRWPRRARLPFITTLHGTDITLVGNDRSFLPITRFSIEQSDGVTAISQLSAERHARGIRHQAAHRSDSQFCELRSVLRSRRSDAARAQWAPNGEPILMHLSNFRPVKRVTDVVEIFALVREKMPAKLVLIGDGPDRGAAEYLVRKKSLTKDVFLLGKQDQVLRKAGPGRSVSAAVRSRIVRAGRARSDGLRSSGGRNECRRLAGSGGARRRRLSGPAARCGCRREMRARNSFARRSRPRDGAARRIDARKKFCANDMIPMYEAYYERILNSNSAKARA